MFRIDKEKIGGNIRHNSDSDATEGNIGNDEDFGHPCCEGDECQLPEWAADDQ
jgi:hypothetical protein